MRLLYVSTSTTLGGAEKTLYTLAGAMRARDIAIPGVVSLKPRGAYGERIAALGIPVFSLGSGRCPGPATLARLARLIRRERPDVVHAFLFQAVQACRLLRRLGTAEFKLVSSPRVTYRTRGGVSLALDRLLRPADDLLISESDASRSHLIGTLGYDPAKVLRIYNGVEPGLPPDAEARERERARLGVGPGDILIGAVGRLDPQKGHARLLEAVAQLRVLKSVRCVIIGDGPLREPLKNLIRALKLYGAATLLGEQTDVRSRLAALDIFAQPSLWEGLPNALLEAMASGLPVVATRVDGIPEVVSEGVCGLLCESDDALSLHRALSELAARPELRAALGAQARRAVLERFRLDAMLENYREAYGRLA